MTRRPFDPREIDRDDPGLGRVADELERYAGLTASEVARGLDERVMAALDAAPPPRRGILAQLLAPFAAGAQGRVARAAMVGATMALAILAVVVAGELAGVIGNDGIGNSPAPTISASPTVSPSPSPSPTESPSPSPSPSVTHEPTLAPTPRPSPAETPGETAEPTDHETPEAEDDHSETPRPSESGNSGPGGGSGDDAS